MSSAHPVKEPSMDEILASIRRIIESGDDRPALAGLTAKSRDRKRDGMSADAADGGMPGGGGEPKAVARLLAPPAARPQDAAGSPGQASAGTPNGGHSGDAPAAVRSPADDDAPGKEAQAGGEAVVSPSRDEPLPLFRPTPLSDAAGMLPAFWLKPERRASSVAAPEVPSGSSGADWIGDGEAAALAEEGRSAEDDVAPTVLTDPAPGKIPWTDADGSEASFGEVALPDDALDFDEEDFAEELRNEARLTGGEAGPGMDALQKDAAAPALAPAALNDPAPASTPAGAAALISDAAGEQVAAAFDDLARAIREGQMKSMEEMAREMLRPMLQEWLDDNLPRLVERLVRDEIERVARGGRR